MAKPSIQPRIFKGTRDFLPEKMIPREEILRVMRETFQQFGFEPIETPAIEYLNVLAGKYGEDADRLIYRLNYKPGSTDEAALHYDLTVPFSRVIAMNPQLPKPFKRYQMQPVWRADSPQPHQGRFREFYQCDIDVVGSHSMMSDAELVAIVFRVLRRLGFEGFVTKVNNRKILNGLVQYIGLDASRTGEICRSIDKLDKVSFDVVRGELAEKGIDPQAIARLETVISAAPHEDPLAHFEALFEGIASAMEGLHELRQLFTYLAAMGVDAAYVRFDLSLARGLDYYTGPIFETVLPAHPHIGSLTGGGRYDTLIGMFSGTDLPAVGTTLGLDRIMTAMDQLGMLPPRASRTHALVALFGPDTAVYALAVAAQLREGGLNIEVYPEADKLGKQFGYADKKAIPYVIIAGPDEMATGQVALKHMITGQQTTMPIEAAAGVLRAGA